MSDCCSICFDCFTKDLCEFDEYYWDKFTQDGPVGSVEAEVNAADGVWSGDRWPLHVPFLGCHGCGCNYDAGYFHCLGDGVLWYSITAMDGMLVVPVDSAGRVSDYDLAFMRKFVLTRDIASRLLSK